jgi:hypothetical protein
MSNWQLKNPVAFIIFKRPDVTAKVFEAIRQAKPSKLFVIADGARLDVLGEAEKCAATRAIIDKVDWNCEVFKNYSDINMGCKHRVSSGLNWVFENVEEAIILEDDCLPHPTFFRFCEELLEKYRYEEKIMSIGGTNLFTEWKSNTQSYFFSNYFHCWGWATWKRVWSNYDVEMKLWSDSKIKKKVKDVIGDKEQYLNRKKHLDNTYCGKVDSWDYQFSFMCLANSGLSIRPSVNLISNIGFTEEATHTISKSDVRANLRSKPMVFPLKEPANIAVDRNHDYEQYQKVWKKSLLQQITYKAKKLQRLLLSIS